MQTVCILSHSNLETDPRVNRQIRFLADQYRLITIGLEPSGVDGVEHVPMPNYTLWEHRPVRIIRKCALVTRTYGAIFLSNPLYRWLRRTTPKIKADLFIVNDLMWLPPVYNAARGVRIIFDAHEYYPEEQTDRLFTLFHKPFREHLCKKYFPKVNGTLTVCDTIADRYAVDTGVRPRVVTNAPSYYDLQPRPATSTKIRLVHHGYASRGRKLESLIKMFDYLDERFDLTFMLMRSLDPYYDELRAKAAGKPVHFRDPVPMRDLPRVLNEYDIGVYILEPDNFNHACALPNKIFEFIQGRLGIGIGPSTEMARVVRKWDCGVVAEDFSAEKLAAKLNALDAEKINYYKSRSHAAAAEVSAEKNRDIFLDVVANALR